MKTKQRPPEADTLIFHRRMYERRMRRLKQRGGLTEQEVANEANDPRLFRKGEDTETNRAASSGNG
jgi:hypothetical protein